MFASRSLALHLLRGAAGAGSLVGAVTLAARAPGLTALLMVAGLVLLRGCPLCWTLGLLQTLRGGVRTAGPPAERASTERASTERASAERASAERASTERALAERLCVDGSCAVRRSKREA